MSEKKNLRQGIIDEFNMWKEHGEKHTGIPKHQLEKIENGILWYIDDLATKLQKRKWDTILVIAKRTKELEDVGLTDRRLTKVLREAYGSAGKAEAYEEFLVLVGTKETKKA